MNLPDASYKLAAHKSLTALARPKTPPEWLLLITFGVYTFVYPFAILLLSLDLMPFGMEWMSSLLLAMLGIAVWGWLWANFSNKGLALGAILFALGVAVEYIGVSTGIPFGSYRYTGVLVPEPPGGVPLAIGFAWLLIVVSGLFTAQWALARLSSSHKAWQAYILGAILAVGLDLLLEPVAYHVKKYWLWESGTVGYYGVPWSNFAAWFIIALVMNLLLARSLHSNSLLKWGWLPFTLYCMNIVMFGLVNMTHGFWLSSLIGIILLGLLLTFGVARRKKVAIQL